MEDIEGVMLKLKSICMKLKSIFNNCILLLCNKMPVALVFEFYDPYKLNHSIKLIVSYSPKFIEKIYLFFFSFLQFAELLVDRKRIIYTFENGEKK